MATINISMGKVIGILFAGLVLFGMSLLIITILGILFGLLTSQF
jgi:hypothetical protein